MASKERFADAAKETELKKEEKKYKGGRKKSGKSQKLGQAVLFDFVLANGGNRARFKVNLLDRIHKQKRKKAELENREYKPRTDYLEDNLFSTWLSSQKEGHKFSSDNYDSFCICVYETCIHNLGMNEKQIVDGLFEYVADKYIVPTETAFYMRTMTSDFDSKSFLQSDFFHFMYSLMGVVMVPWDSTKHTPQYELPSKRDLINQAVTIDGKIVRVQPHSSKYIHRLLITGEGGQGKTVLLQRWHLAALEKGQYAFYIPFCELIPQIKREKFPESLIVDRINTLCLRQYNKPFTDVDGRASVDTNPPILVLLDGFNELLLHNGENRAAVEAIRSELIRIAKEWKRVRFVISSKPLSFSEYPEFNEFKVATLGGVPDKNLSDAPSELKQIIKNPFFFHLYKEKYKLVRKEERLKVVSKKGGFLICIYKGDCKRQVDIQKKGVVPRPLYYFLYNVVLPHIALYMNNSRRDYLYQSELGDLIDYLFEKKNYSSVFFELALKDMDTNIKLADMEKHKAIITDVLETEGMLVRDEYCNWKIGSSYKHEIWRDFLAAFCASISVRAMSAQVGNLAFSREYALNLNVSEQASEFVCELLELNNHDTAEKNFTKLFPVKGITGNRTAIFGCFHLAYNAWQLLCYIKPKPKLDEVQYLFLGIFCDKAKKSLYKYDPTFFRNEIKTARVFARACELSRIKKDYDRGLEYVDFCQSKLTESEAVVVMKNQKAKILLSIWQDLLLGNTPVFPEPYKEYSTTQLFSEGSSLLDECCEEGYIRSSIAKANILGWPAPFITTEIDRVKAFEVLMNACSYPENRDSEGWAYLIRQICLLLVTNAVRITFFESEERYDVIAGNGNPWQRSSENIKLVRYLMQNVYEQKMPLVNYIRGCIAENDEDAIKWFHMATEEYKLLYHCRLHFQFGEDYDLKQEFNGFLPEINKAGLGQYDKVHPIYHYIDSKSLVLAYENNESWKSFFADIEAKMNEECRNLVKKIQG